MFLGRPARRSLFVAFAIASILPVSPALAQAPIAPGTVLVELTADPASHLILDKDVLEVRLCDASRLTKDPDPAIITYDDQVDLPTDPPDPPPDPPGGLEWLPGIDRALFPTLADTAPRVVYRLTKDVVFDARGQATAETIPTRLCGRATAPVELSCGTWNVKLRLASEQAPSTLALFSGTSGDGGTFTLETTHDLLLTFHHPKSDTRISWTTQRKYSGFGSWGRMPGDKGVEKAGGYAIDTDCDGYQETWVDGTTELHLGWDADAKARTSCFGDAGVGGQLCLGPQVEK